MQEFDMEVTDERFNYMKKILVMLYADQIGMEVKNIKVRPVDKGIDDYCNDGHNDSNDRF